SPAASWSSTPRPRPAADAAARRIAHTAGVSPEDAALRLATLLIATGLLAACASQPMDPTADPPPDAVPTTRTAAPGAVTTRPRARPAGRRRQPADGPARRPAARRGAHDAHRGQRRRHHRVPRRRPAARGPGRALARPDLLPLRPQWRRPARQGRRQSAADVLQALRLELAAAERGTPSTSWERLQPRAFRGRGAKILPRGTTGRISLSFPIALIPSFPLLAAGARG